MSADIGPIERATRATPIKAEHYPSLLDLNADMDRLARMAASEAELMTKNKAAQRFSAVAAYEDMLAAIDYRTKVLVKIRDDWKGPLR